MLCVLLITPQYQAARVIPGALRGLCCVVRVDATFKARRYGVVWGGHVAASGYVAGHMIAAEMHGTQS